MGFIRIGNWLVRKDSIQSLSVLENGIIIFFCDGSSGTVLFEDSKEAEENFERIVNEQGC